MTRRSSTGPRCHQDWEMDHTYRPAPAQREAPDADHHRRAARRGRDLGPYWPAHFAAHEFIDVSKALEREMLAGTLADAITLTDHGRRLLRESGEPPRDRGSTRAGPPLGRAGRGL